MNILSLTPGFDEVLDSLTLALGRQRIDKYSALLYNPESELNMSYVTLKVRVLQLDLQFKSSQKFGCFHDSNHGLVFPRPSVHRGLYFQALCLQKKAGITAKYHGKWWYYFLYFEQPGINVTEKLKGDVCIMVSGSMNVVLCSLLLTCAVCVIISKGKFLINFVINVTIFKLCKVGKIF